MKSFVGKSFEYLSQTTPSNRHTTRIFSWKPQWGRLRSIRLSVVIAKPEDQHKEIDLYGGSGGFSS
jgi:hypothetical protein